MSGTCGRAAYVFRVQFRVRPSRPEVGVEPDRFETVATLDAAPPGESGWLFFRDHLWRGELNDESGVRDLLESALGTTVESVTCWSPHSGRQSSP